MFPRPATVRWSRIAAFTGARRPASRSREVGRREPRARAAPGRAGRARCSSASSRLEQEPRAEAAQVAVGDPRAVVELEHRALVASRARTGSRRSSAGGRAARARSRGGRAGTCRAARPPSTRSPASSAAIHAGSSGRVSRGVVDPRRGDSPPLDARREPAALGLDLGELRHYGSCRARSGACARRLVPELVGGEHLGRRLGGGRLVARVDLGEHVARGDLVAALRAADDPDRVVDRVLLRPPPGAEVERRVADLDRAEPARRSPPPAPSPRRTTGAAGSAVSVGIAALRADPALVGRDAPSRRRPPARRAGAPRPRRSRDRTARAGARPSASTSSEKSAGPSPRIVAERLAELERVPDRLPERLVHVGEHADDLAPGPARRARSSSRRARARPRASS